MEHTQQSPSIWDNSQEQYSPGGFKAYWETLDEVSRYQARRISGHPHVHFVAYMEQMLARHFGRTPLHAVSLGCSESLYAPEFHLAAAGLLAGCDILDVAQGLLRKQQALAQSKGLERFRYLVQDLNTVKLAPESIHFAWGFGTVHHVEDLDHLFAQVNAALKPGGLFFMREYVGPDRIQLTARQLSVANRILAALPENLRRLSDGSLKSRIEPTDVEALIQVDPSESVRSSEIMRILPMHMRVLEVHHTGGTLLHPLLNGIANNFEGSPEADAMLRVLIAMDEILIDGGVLPSDYVVCVAGKLP